MKNEKIEKELTPSHIYKEIWELACQEIEVVTGEVNKESFIRILRERFTIDYRESE